MSPSPPRGTPRWRDVGVGTDELDQPVVLRVAEVGPQTGPAVALLGAVHGDELVGPYVLKRILYGLARVPVHRRIVIVPVVNPTGVARRTRAVAGNHDLNRAFPAEDGKGTLAARTAWALAEDILADVTTVLDLHAGSGTCTNAPQLRADPDDRRGRMLAALVGVVPLVLKGAPEGSLRAWCRSSGITALTYEGGLSAVLDGQATTAGAHVAWQTLVECGAVDRPADEPPNGVAHPWRCVRETKWVRSPSGGLFARAVNPGEDVTDGQVLGELWVPGGELNVVRHTGPDAWVVGLQVAGPVRTGDALVHLGW